MPDALREQLIDQLTGQNAHLNLENAVRGLSPEEVGRRPETLPYSIWEQVEHIRISQSDIVRFCMDPDYKSPEWPDGYWPADPAPGGMAQWERSLEAISGDLQQMVEWVGDPERDLFEPFPHGDGQTLFREALLIIDHNAYHTGQIVTIRRLLGLWE